MRHKWDGGVEESLRDSSSAAYGRTLEFSPGKIGLVVGNTNASLYGSPDWFLRVLDKELRYPTHLARESMSRWEAPVAGTWDGWIRLLHRTKSAPPEFPTGLVPRVQDLALKWGLEAEIEDTRERPAIREPDIPCQPIIDRDYQLAAEKAALREGRGVLDMPPRSGKTRTMISIVSKLALPTLWIAPTDAIVRQTVGAIRAFFGKGYATQQKGSKNAGDASQGEYRVLVCTAATAVRLPPEVFHARKVLVVDEFHHASAKTYREIMKMCGHIYFRFGMTGTFFRSGDDAMAMHALLSTAIYRVSPQDLVAAGHLVPCRVAYIPVEAPRLRCPRSSTDIVPQLRYGIQEHDHRNQLVAYAAVYLERVGRKVLVLVSTKEQGRRVERMIAGQLGPGAEGSRYKPVEFVSTDRDRNTQGRILEAFNTSDAVRVLIGTSLVGEGVDLPPADALVYARGEKAEVTLTQNAYRVITAISGKREAVIVDFSDRHSAMLLRHTKERAAIFFAEPIFSVEVIPSIKNFGIWCQNLG